MPWNDRQLIASRGLGDGPYPRPMTAGQIEQLQRQLAANAKAEREEELDEYRARHQRRHAKKQNPT